MKPLELYKKLPKKNCGKCKQKTCMPFALSVIKGEAELSECPYLTAGDVEKIRASLTVKDWRQELIARLMEEVKRLDFIKVYEGIGAQLDNDDLIINCFGKDYRVTKNGEVIAKEHVSPWIRILLLHYVKTSGKGDISGKWVSLRELKGGIVKIASFTRDCEEPLLELFEKNFNLTSMILKKLGASICNGFPTKYAWNLNLLPKIPILILYWPEEEGFKSKVSILFDSTADRFLDVESLIFLVEGLIRNIERGIS